MVMTNDKWFNELDGEQACPCLAVATEQSERSDAQAFGLATALVVCGVLGVLSIAVVRDIAGDER